MSISTLQAGLARRATRPASAPAARHLIALCLATLAGLAQADDTVRPTSPAGLAAATTTALAAPPAPDEFTRRDPAPLRLALDSPVTSTRPSGAPGAAAAAPFKPPWLTGSDVHKYLGLGTLLAVGVTAASAPGEGCEKNCSASTTPRQTSGTTHTRAARTAAALAGATVATGLLVHWDDFHLQDGIRDPDNQHVLLGLIGSGLMVYAVNKSMKSAVPTQHSAYAELGGMAMAVAVKLTW
jgi:hypothetical protein